MDISLQTFIFDIFSGINSEVLVECFVSCNILFLKVGNRVCRVSIKKRYDRLICTMYVYSFINYLEDHSVPIFITNALLEWHFLDDKLKTSFSACLKLWKINRYFVKNKSILLLVLEYFTKEFDVIVYGDVNDFIYVKRDFLIRQLMYSKNFSTDGIYFSNFYYQVFDNKSNFGRFFFQIYYNDHFGD